jgi:hypothetical protein
MPIFPALNPRANRMFTTACTSCRSNHPRPSVPPGVEQKHIEARITVGPDDIWCLAIPGIRINTVDEDNDPVSPGWNKPAFKTNAVGCVKRHFFRLGKTKLVRFKRFRLGIERHHRTDDIPTGTQVHAGEDSGDSDNCRYSSDHPSRGQPNSRAHFFHTIKVVEQGWDESNGIELAVRLAQNSTAE